MSNPNPPPATGNGCASAEGRQRIEEIFRLRRLKAQALARPGMEESKPMGMEHLAGRGVAR